MDLSGETVEGPRSAREGEAVRPPAATPRMPERPSDDAGGPAKDELHAFHLTGRPAEDGADGPRPIWPASLLSSTQPSDAWNVYPLLLAMDVEEDSADEEAVRPFPRVVERALDELRNEGHESPRLREHGGRLAWCVSRAAGSAAKPRQLGALFDDAAKTYRDGFDRSAAADAELESELSQLATRLPERDEVLTLDPLLSLRLHVAAVHRERARRTAAFRAETDRLLGGLDALLRADARHGEDGSSPSRLSSALGSAGRSFIDPEKLASNLPAYRGSERLGPERRARLEDCARRLADGRDEVLQWRGVHLLHRGSLPEALELDGVRVEERADALDAAPAAFERAATRLVDLFRAIRMTRLELAGAYDPDLHDPALARLDWQGLTASELMLAPRVVVLESASRVSGESLAAFSAVLRSGRPIHVLIEDAISEASGRTRENMGRFHVQLAYLSIAHREVFVLQSTPAMPEHLASGLARMARCLRPGVAIVAAPSWSGPVAPWIQLVAAHAGRATPTMRHDPEAGTSWADRFDLEGNRHAESDWTESTLRFIDADGGDETRSMAITYADVAAIDPVYRGHLRLIPETAWDDEQIELANYLQLDEDERAYRLPYIWTLDEDGTLRRALVTRDLAFACLDRSRSWRVLQELAGTRNEYARRAADNARHRALEEAAREREEIEARLAARVEAARWEGATEAIERLVAALMETGTATAAAAAETSAPAAEAPAARAADAAETEVAAAKAEAIEVEEDAFEVPVLDEPYIDSFLCTTCNECTNLNPRMFRYDGNKQAYLADVQAGSYEELVVAAEKCPARCIHPGAPRPGDATATEELIARAKAFG